MSRHEDNELVCPTHGTLFLPALLRGSPLWKRVQEGLRLFAVPEDDLSAITSFRLDMVQRPRFTAQLTRPTAGRPGTYGFLLGDAANAIHFWPGRGLNSGLDSAVSLARSLSRVWRGRALRDAHFIRHEAAMSMPQYRHRAARGTPWSPRTSWARPGRSRTSSSAASSKQQAASSKQHAGHGRTGGPPAADIRGTGGRGPGDPPGPHALDP
ncbi:FAD-dependent monooxygenase [Streptomyces sp. RM72]|uniref:FAD-dependent monooxygenase n=1 Tax=Streptomyces sp. RM72 TaxID=1115510 RepID=UPI001FFC5E36|nr:FAD-dependent monooxygenase [Streptomyces sp. RM72]